MDTEGPTVQQREPCSMFRGSLGGRGVCGDRYTCVHEQGPLLSTWDYHKLVNQLSSNITLKKSKEKWITNKDLLYNKGNSAQFM